MALLYYQHRWKLCSKCPISFPSNLPLIECHGFSLLPSRIHCMAVNRMRVASTEKNAHSTGYKSSHHNACSRSESVTKRSTIQSSYMFLVHQPEAETTPSWLSPQFGERNSRLEALSLCSRTLHVPEPMNPEGAVYFGPLLRSSLGEPLVHFSFEIIGR